jgi:hypothetical protein
MLGNNLDKSILGNGIFGKVILKACKWEGRVENHITPVRRALSLLPGSLANSHFDTTKKG